MYPRYQNNQDADDGTHITRNISNSNRKNSDNSYDRKTRSYENEMNGHKNANKIIQQQKY